MRTIAVLALVAILAGCGGNGARKTRPDVQRTLDSLVTGPKRIAPGLTAFVAGPRGTWLGSAGWANVTKQVRMEPDARLRLESVSKLWTATVIAKLATEHKLGLDDTVDHWLPGLFPYGKLITIRELLNHTSGMVDNNDFDQNPRYWLGKIHDPALRAELLATAAEIEKDHAHVYPTMLLIRAAAAIPLQFEPGTSYHYSNIAYETAGVIAERAGRAPLSELYRRIIIDPLDLTSAAYAPHGTIPGPHPVGYMLRGGKAIAATRWFAGGLAAEGGIVVNAQDEARFLVALVQGKIVPPTMLAQMTTGSGPAPSYGLGTVVERTCAGKTLTHNGGGAAWAATAAVSLDGSRVAVLLFNGRPSPEASNERYVRARSRLFCSA
jgi:D-alanyl-D-alanine carboxypeptidase